MKLLSMTDFVLGSEKNFSENREAWAIDCLESIFEYANFLKQPLKLEMFVPCDEECDLVSEPEYYKYFNDFNQWQDSKFEGFFDDEEDFQEWNYRCDKLYKAKEKVLFEGFKFKKDKLGRQFLINKEEKSIFLDGQGWALFYETIEDLVELDIELNNSTIEQLSLTASTPQR